MITVMSKPKVSFLQIRISDAVKEDFQITAELRGLSMSALVHSLVVKAIREEKDRDPSAFKQQGNAKRNRKAGARDS